MLIKKKIKKRGRNFPLFKKTKQTSPFTWLKGKNVPPGWFFLKNKTCPEM